MELLEFSRHLQVVENYRIESDLFILACEFGLSACWAHDDSLIVWDDPLLSAPYCLALSAFGQTFIERTLVRQFIR